MDDNERKMFFNTADKPLGLPAEFTTSTTIQKTPTADWLKNTYAKAYMCQVLSQSDGNIRNEFRFTEGEKKNARYFWNGKGKDCLSRSTILSEPRSSYIEVPNAQEVRRHWQGIRFWQKALSIPTHSMTGIPPMTRCLIPFR